MSKHLWEICRYKYGLGESYYEDHYSSWDEFITSEVWMRNWVSDGFPVFWNWAIDEDDDYDRGYKSETVHLVWLCPAPCSTRLIEISVTKADERAVRNWLIEHKFICCELGNDDV